MAKIFPTFDNIKRLKVKPTDGEWFLINYLVEHFDEDVEVYFQPFLNGDKPDIILMKKGAGVIIIEVKDWNLASYHIDIQNKWYLTKDNQLVKSPFQQVFRYKDNLFNLHINGLLEKKLKNKYFYKVIRPYVYFHNTSKQSIDHIFHNSISHYDTLFSKNNSAFKEKIIEYGAYEKKHAYLMRKKQKIERDRNQLTLLNNNLKKIFFPTDSSTILFEESIYKEFKRYLQPPFHTISQGKEIKFEKKQAQLIQSKPIHQKIKGVAGSGKTVVLAKRAVNAHKRHGDTVLILTFNLTLKSYIHDRISDVREDFSWGNFHITNYHQFITQVLHNAGIEIDLPEGLSKKERSIELDRRYYSNLDVFEGKSSEIQKYQSIFIDEVQDYQPAWIKIIRKYFLEENGEMVLFGDEKQNIYERDIDADKNPRTPNGFGRWIALSKSIRYKENSRILRLAKKFQEIYFYGKYEIDNYHESAQMTSDLGLGIYKIAHFADNNLMELTSEIFQNIKANKLHPNDVCILSSKIEVIREIDYFIRNDFNERTITTFESKETYDSLMMENNGMDLEHLRKIKKIGFNLNSGVIKLSTIQSFKGYESPTVFLIVDEHDHDEMVYAGITRAKFNIMVFTHERSKYNDFFNSELEKEIGQGAAPGQNYAAFTPYHAPVPPVSLPARSCSAQLPTHI